MNKRTLFMAFAILGIVGASLAEGHKKSLVRNILYVYPQAGLSINSPSNIDINERSGFIAGIGIRLGGKRNFVTGAYFHSTSFTGIIDPNASSGQQRVHTNYLIAPASFGYHIVNRRLLKLKTSIGGAYYHLLDKTYDADPNLEQIDFTKGLWAARAGLGIEVWRIAVDAYYDYGFTNSFQNISDSKYRTLHASLGFRF